MSLHTVFKIVANTTYNSTNLLNIVNLFSWMAKDQRPVLLILVSPRAQVLLPSYQGCTWLDSFSSVVQRSVWLYTKLVTYTIYTLSFCLFLCQFLFMFWLKWLRFILVSWVFPCGFNKDFVELFIFFVVRFVITSDQMLNACFWEGLDDELYHLLPHDKCLVPLDDFVADAVNEDNYYHHPVPTRKCVSTPAHLKPVPFTYLITRTISIIAPVFPRAWEAVSNSAYLTAKVADPSIISVRAALNKFPILRSPSPESDPESAPVCESSLESTQASEPRQESITPAKKMRLEEKEKGQTLNISFIISGIGLRHDYITWSPTSQK